MMRILRISAILLPATQPSAKSILMSGAFASDFTIPWPLKALRNLTNPCSIK